MLKSNKDKQETFWAGYTRTSSSRIAEGCKPLTNDYSLDSRLILRIIL